MVADRGWTRRPRATIGAISNLLAEMHDVPLPLHERGTQAMLTRLREAG
jgi:hypothetical protein